MYLTSHHKINKWTPYIYYLLCANVITSISSPLKTVPSSTLHLTLAKPVNHFFFSPERLGQLLHLNELQARHTGFLPHSNSFPIFFEKNERLGERTASVTSGVWSLNAEVMVSSSAVFFFICHSVYSMAKLQTPIRGLKVFSTWVKVHRTLC